MFKKLLFISSFLASWEAYAVNCIQGSLCNQTVVTTITQNLTSAQNQVGQSIASNVVATPATQLGHKKGTINGWGIYGTDAIPPTGTFPSSWVYNRVDDYMSVALGNPPGACGGVPGSGLFFPYNGPTINVETCQHANFRNDGEHTRVASAFQTRIRIDKRLLSGNHSRNILVGQYGLCQPGGCRTKDVILGTIYLNFNITVPENCYINAGEVITVDFNDIPSTAFTAANTPAKGVNTKPLSVQVRCDNPLANESLVLRLLTNRVSGNNLVSDNPDVGFRILWGNSVITPNNFNSYAPFSIKNNVGTVNLNVQPMSITGKTPKEGPVVSEALLKVDFP